MIGGAALLADGVLTPAVTVTTAIEGLRGIPQLSINFYKGTIKVCEEKLGKLGFFVCKAIYKSGSPI
ncbi:hypothetical protein EfmAA290_01650 [Enterococcus faecium]|nr:hypothetical protein EfmAA290_01650 [Enterococcus faecium]